MNEHEKPQIDFMHKLARQIVERRNLVFLFVILAAIFTVFSVRWVKVETDMTTYLPKTSETRMGLDIMDEQFTTYGSADVMVANITPAEADELSDAENTAAKLKKLRLSIELSLGQGGKAFGSVTTADIAALIADKSKLTIDRHQLVLESPIKTLGSFEIPVKLHPAVEASDARPVRPRVQLCGVLSRSDRALHSTGHTWRQEAAKWAEASTATGSPKTSRTLSRFQTS